jgi:putative FmdB family regulatory protein
MPTYEYACSECDNHWEEVQRITEPALEVCPRCKKKSAHRQISAGNFILKGGGWYSDLYSSKSNKAESSESKDKGETKTEAKADGKAESKGESKAETKSEKKDSTAPAAAPAPAAPSTSSSGGTGTKT